MFYANPFGLLVFLVGILFGYLGILVIKDELATFNTRTAVLAGFFFEGMAAFFIIIAAIIIF